MIYFVHRHAPTADDRDTHARTEPSAVNIGRHYFRTRVLFIPFCSSPRVVCPQRANITHTHKLKRTISKRYKPPPPTPFYRHRKRRNIFHLKDARGVSEWMEVERGNRRDVGRR